MSPSHPSPLLLRKQSLPLIFPSLQFLHTLVVVVDRGGKGAFGAVLADDEGVEVGFEGCGGYAGWGVGVAEGALRYI